MKRDFKLIAIEKRRTGEFVSEFASPQKAFGKADFK